MITFGQKLKKARQELSFSQSYLAENIGVSVQSISNWECDTTMPDISQIVPLASILGVSTDFLLGTTSDEKADLMKLETEVTNIWATYSVNTPHDNADYMVYELYKNFLRTYPLNYQIKYKCALALHDYLIVATIRHKFEISRTEFLKLYSECEKLLLAICKYDSDIQHQIETRSLLVQHYTLNQDWDKALATAESLPETCGIKQNIIRTIAQSRNLQQEAQTAAILSSYAKCQDYTMSLYYTAKCISDNEMSSWEDIIQAWLNMVQASELFVSQFASIYEPKVNTYEQNPFCYLITAYASMCNDYLRFQKLDDALSCLEHATDGACKLYSWANEHKLEQLVMDDINFFVDHTISWCYNKAPALMAQSFTTHPRYMTCEKCMASIRL